MVKDRNQKILLRIVQEWKINQKPEYRGFRCAKCQKYIHKAWHHWLKTAGFKTPVHFCNSCEKKFKLLKIKKNYKTFTCDKCGKKMYKAWHVWTRKDNVLSEDHFCKKCGEKLKFGKEIKGIIYDLDGTIISTIKLHESAWLYAGRKFNITISREMLLNQSGISNEAAAKMMLPNNKKHLAKKFIAAKVKYVMENTNQVVLFPSIIKTISQLFKSGYKVWICTSAPKNFVIKILDNFSELRKLLRHNIIWRKMYKREKPSPDVLNLVIKKMNLAKSQVCYIGDAFSDYKTAIRAKVKFIYFCPNLKKRDSRISKSIPTISSHKHVFEITRRK